MRSEVDDRIAKISTLRDPAALQQQREALYALGPKAIEALHDPIFSVYDRAQPHLIAALSAIPDDRSTAVLMSLLHNRFPERKRQALYGLALRNRPPSGNVVKALAGSRLASDREWALYALSQTQDLTAGALFQRLADDADSGVRTQAARGLRLFPGPKSAADLAKLMGDPNGIVATEATISLGRLDPANPKVRARLKDLEPMLKNGSVNQREELAPLVAEIGTPEAENLLASMLTDPDPRIRVVAASAYPRLRKVRDPKPLLRALQTDPDPHVRPRAARALALLHVSQSVAVFRTMVFAKDRAAARTAALALKDMCDPMSVGLFYGMLKVPDFEVRRLSAVALMRMAGARADYFPIIDQLLADTASPSVEARRSAATYLADLPGPQVAAKLDALQYDPSATVRLAAMDARKKQMGMSRILPEVIEHPRPSWLDPMR